MPSRFALVETRKEWLETLDRAIEALTTISLELS